MSSIGSLLPSPVNFDSPNVGKEWAVFKQQLTFYLAGKELSEAVDAVKVGVMMTCLGKKGVEVFNSLGLTDSTLYVDVIKAFDTLCLNKRNSVYERYLFNKIVQQEGTTFDSFLLDLKSQAACCDFDKNEKDNLIRDRIVVGVSDSELTESLLCHGDKLKLKEAVDYCRAAEAAKRQTSTIHGEGRKQGTLAVDAVTTAPRLFTRRPEGKYDKQQVDRRGMQPTCKNCGYSSSHAKCPAAEQECYSCHGKGHFGRMCFYNVSKSSGTKEDNQARKKVSAAIHAVSADNELEDNSSLSWYVNLLIHNTDVCAKIDTGAEANVMNLGILNKMNPKPNILPSPVLLTPYGASDFMKPLGRIVVKTIHREITKFITFEIVSGNVECILGLKTCVELGLIKKMYNVGTDSLLNKYSDAFQGLGKMPGKVKIYLDPNVPPVIDRQRGIPYRLRDKLKLTLADLEKRGVISKVEQPTDWVSNLIIVGKPNGDLRLCLCPKNLNKAIKRPRFHIPTLDEITVNLANKSLFSVLDMKQGFWHMVLDDESSMLTTFHTPFGRYKWNRLCFGVSCAPEIFMAKCVEIFGDIPGVFPYFDDLIISGIDMKDHDQTLELVLKRAREYGVKFNPEKIQLRMPNVRFMGVVVGKSGVQPDVKHVQAIRDMPRPLDKKGVLRFLGMCKYLSKFIPTFSQCTEHLRGLTRCDSVFNWGPEHEKEFNNLKKLLARAPVLRFYDPNLPLEIQTDSSQSGMGSVLLQAGHPLAFASRALTDAEQAYPQIDKELLACVFAVEKFHQLTYGNFVHIKSDHRPLESLFKKSLHKVPSRIQKLMIRLMRYNVEISYMPGREMYIADALSRAYLSDEKPDLSYSVLKVHSHAQLSNINISPERKEQFIQATNKDAELCGLKKFAAEGWPAKKFIPNNLLRYYNIKDYISESEGLLFFEDRLMIPKSLIPFMLKLVHECHFGVIKTKQRARQCVFWLNMAADIEKFVLNCDVCSSLANNNKKEPLMSYTTSRRVWERVGCDLLFFGGRHFLVCYDDFSNWIELCTIDNLSSDTVITKLKVVFSRLGVPDTLVSDNVPFGSFKFQQFAKDWNFKSVLISPKHSQSNGLAEKGVGVAKNILRKCLRGGVDVSYALLEYRNSPLKDIGYSPAQIMMCRSLKSKLPCSPLALRTHVQNQDNLYHLRNESRAKQAFYFNRGTAQLDELLPGTRIYFKKDLSDSPAHWHPGIVVEVLPYRSYLLRDDRGRIFRRNRRFIRKNPCSTVEVGHRVGRYRNDAFTTNDSNVNYIESPSLNLPVHESSSLSEPVLALPQTTRAGREVRKPSYLNDYVT